VHTSAHPPIQPAALAEYTGTLTRPGEARTKVLDQEGHHVPVLCLHLELDNLLHTHVRVEQPFPAGHLAQAKAAAHRYRKGMRVTVQAPLVGISLVAANATHIHVITPEEETPCQP